MSTHDMTGKPFNFDTLVEDIEANELARRDALRATGAYFVVTVLLPYSAEWSQSEHSRWLRLPAVEGLEAAEAIRRAYSDSGRATDIVPATDADHYLPQGR